MKKISRHNKILELIEKKLIETQEEIAVELIALGYKVTQATISRDIKELGLAKISTGDGRQYYIKAKDRETIDGKFAEIMRDVVLKTSIYNNTIVIKTIDGFGKAAKAAFQSVGSDLGCVADDNTVLMFFAEDALAADFYKKIKEIIY